MFRSRPLAFTCLLLLLSAYFAVFAADGLNAYFTQDDGENLLTMHRYFESSLWEMAGSTLQVVTGTFRPLGGIFYLAMYRLTGFNPFPFRAVCLCLMLANVWLAFAVLLRFSGSIDTAFVGALLAAHHPALLWLFYSSGTIYEILCFLFYFLALLYYWNCRRRAGFEGPWGPPLSWLQVAVLLACTALALDSKEMAMTLPAALLLVELIYFPPKRWTMRGTGRFVAWQCRGVAATALLTAAVISAKMLTRNPLSDDPRYALQSLRTAFLAMCDYHDFLLYRDHFLSIPWLFALWTAMAIAAVALRSPSMKFGLCFLIVALAPVCVILPRGGYMLYLPLMGWALYVGSLLVEIRERLISLIGVRPLTAGAIRVASVMSIAAVIVPLHARSIAHFLPEIHRDQSESRRIVTEMKNLEPQIAKSSFVLLVNDPVSAGWNLMSFTQLAYADPTIFVDRTKMIPTSPTGVGMTLYDHVFSDDHGHLREMAGARPVTGGLHAPPIQVQFLPARVSPGQEYAVFIPQYAAQSVDVAVRVVHRDSSSVAVIRDWCTLDASGRAVLVAPAELKDTAIFILKSRAGDGPWLATEGEVDVTHR